MKLTQMFNERDHRRMINRYVGILNGGHNPAHLTREDLEKKIAWNEKELLKKIGETK